MITRFGIATFKRLENLELELGVEQIEEAGGLKLIYIDPPFDVGADLSMDIELGGETFHKEPNILEQIAYRDTWGRRADSFISMIYERLIAVLEDARGNGIEPTPKHIPPDVFDKRAVERGQVVFHDIAFIVKRPRSLALQGSLVAPSQGELVEWEDWWTGGYILENVWQSFRTRQERKLELKTAPHVYPRPGRYTVAVKVIDIFGNDTMTLLPISVG